MDFNALQHKLFEMDPTDPAEDIAKLRAQAGGNAPAPSSFPAVVPFYVKSPTEVLLGNATEGII